MSELLRVRSKYGYPHGQPRFCAWATKCPGRRRFDVPFGLRPEGRVSVSSENLRLCFGKFLSLRNKFLSLLLFNVLCIFVRSLFRMMSIIFSEFGYRSGQLRSRGTARVARLSPAMLTDGDSELRSYPRLEPDVYFTIYFGRYLRLVALGVVYWTTVPFFQLVCLVKHGGTHLKYPLRYLFEVLV